MKFAILTFLTIGLLAAVGVHYSEPLLNSLYMNGLLPAVPPHPYFTSIPEQMLQPKPFEAQPHAEDRTCHRGVVTVQHKGWVQYFCATN